MHMHWNTTKVTVGREHLWGLGIKQSNQQYDLVQPWVAVSIENVYFQEQMEKHNSYVRQRKG